MDQARLDRLKDRAHKASILATHIKELINAKLPSQLNGVVLKWAVVYPFHPFLDEETLEEVVSIGVREVLIAKERDLEALLSVEPNVDEPEQSGVRQIIADANAIQEQ